MQYTNTGETASPPCRARGAHECAERKREGREGDRRWCEPEEPATEKWGKGGPGIRKSERETRGTDGGSRKEKEKKEQEEEVEFWLSGGG